MFHSVRINSAILNWSLYCQHTVWSRVCASVRRPSIHSSVCSSMGLQQQTRCCRFPGGLAGDVDQLPHGAQQHGMWCVHAGSATLSAYVRS